MVTPDKIIRGNIYWNNKLQEYWRCVHKGKDNFTFLVTNERGQAINKYNPSNRKYGMQHRMISGSGLENLIIKNK